MTSLLARFFLYVKIFNIKANPDILFSMAKDMIDELQQDWSDQRPDLNTEAMGVVLRIPVLAKVLGEQAARRLDEYDLQWWQYDVLATLRRQGKPYRMAATGLADAVMLTSGALTNRIDRLENAGLIRRVADEEDRRRVFAQLTRNGLSLIDSATETRFQCATDAIASLDDRQTRQLNGLLRSVLLAQNSFPDR